VIINYLTNQIMKRVEAALYDYPMWKVNSEQLQSQHKGNIMEAKNEKLGIQCLDYISHSNLYNNTKYFLDFAMLITEGEEQKFETC
jgi:hypothetical protein